MSDLMPTPVLLAILQHKINGVTAGGGSGVTVQRVSGTFTTNASGEDAVVCGFQPDLVYCSSALTKTVLSFLLQLHLRKNPEAVRSMSVRGATH